MSNTLVSNEFKDVNGIYLSEWRPNNSIGDKTYAQPPLLFSLFGFMCTRPIVDMNPLVDGPHQWAIINSNVGCLQLENPLTLFNTFCFASKSTASRQGVPRKGGKGGTVGSGSWTGDPLTSCMEIGLMVGIDASVLPQGHGMLQWIKTH